MNKDFKKIKLNLNGARQIRLGSSDNSTASAPDRKNSPRNPYKQVQSNLRISRLKTQLGPSSKSIGYLAPKDHSASAFKPQKPKDHKMEERLREEFSRMQREGGPSKQFQDDVKFFRHLFVESHRRLLQKYNYFYGPYENKRGPLAYKLRSNSEDTNEKKGPGILKAEKKKHLEQKQAKPKKSSGEGSNQRSSKRLHEGQELKRNPSKQAIQVHKEGNVKVFQRREEMQAMIDETLNNSDNQESDLQHLKVDESLLKLFLKYEQGEVVDRAEAPKYWPILASIVIKATKSQSLRKLIDKVESFKMQFKVDDELSTNYSAAIHQAKLNPKKAWKNARMASMMPPSSNNIMDKFGEETIEDDKSEEMQIDDDGKQRLGIRNIQIEQVENLADQVSQREISSSRSISDLSNQQTLAFPHRRQSTKRKTLVYRRISTKNYLANNKDFLGLMRSPSLTENIIKQAQASQEFNLVDEKKEGSEAKQKPVVPFRCGAMKRPAEPVYFPFDEAWPEKKKMSKGSQVLTNRTHQQMSPNPYNQERVVRGTAGVYTPDCNTHNNSVSQSVEELPLVLPQVEASNMKVDISAKKKSHVGSGDTNQSQIQPASKILPAQKGALLKRGSTLPNNSPLKSIRKQAEMKKRVASNLLSSVPHPYEPRTNMSLGPMHLSEDWDDVVRQTSPDSLFTTEPRSKLTTRPISQAKRAPNHLKRMQNYYSNQAREQNRQSRSYSRSSRNRGFDESAQPHVAQPIFVNNPLYQSSGITQSFRERESKEFQTLTGLGESTEERNPYKVHQCPTQASEQQRARTQHQNWYFDGNLNTSDDQETHDPYTTFPSKHRWMDQSPLTTSKETISGSQAIEKAPRSKGQWKTLYPNKSTLSRLKVFI